MRLRSNEVCPVHRSTSCCGREILSKPKLVRLGVQRVEDPHHRRGYRELRLPAEMRKLLNRKVRQQVGICAWAPVASQGSHCQFPFRFIVKTKVSSMLVHHFNFRSVADHLPLLCFVQHSSQCSQSAVGTCRRARKLQLLGAIACNLVDPQHRNRCRLSQPPAVTVELSGFLFESGIVHPIEKAISKLLEDRRFGWK